MKTGGIDRENEIVTRREVLKVRRRPLKRKKNEKEKEKRKKERKRKKRKTKGKLVKEPALRPAPSVTGAVDPV